MSSRLFFIGVDGLNRPMTARFIADGTMPTLERMIGEGISTELFPCFPAYTPTNWAALCTGANTGTHGLPGWSVTMPDGKEVSAFVSCALNAETIWDVAERADHKVCLFNYPASMPSRLERGCAVDNSFGNPQHPQYATPERLSEPPEIGAELVSLFGPYLFGCSTLAQWDTKAQWIGNAGNYLTERKGYTFFYCHFHIIDGLMHRHLAGADPASPQYVAEESGPHMEALREGHRIVDMLIETLTRDATDDDFIAVVSDHGNSPNVRMVDVERFLLEKGYLVLKGEAQAALEKDIDLDRDVGISWDSIDWDRTKAYKKPGIGLDIFINATGEECERIGDDLVRDLRTWVDPETGKTVMSVVLKREDAYPLGFWGTDVGDVIAVYEKGYAWGKPAGGGVLGRGVGANHGPQFPTAHTEFASVLAYLVMKGPHLKRGSYRDPSRLGYPHITDVVPTLCHLLGLRPPAQCQGAIARDFLQGVNVGEIRPRMTPPL